MSRPSMLRTRRKDVNLKPNRRDSRQSRLDRKSSRGMLYENEELRLKTININAEVESRQSDIKKLKRENEMLKKGLWYLRDEYDKLERLIKDKKIDVSSSSTTCTSSSDSETCSSCSEDSEEVETAQNMKNDQRTNLSLHERFDHLSVVTEETSAEHSEHNSNEEQQQFIRETWDNFENGEAIKPDQSYPAYSLSHSQTMPMMGENIPEHFFSPIKPSRSQDDNHFNQMQDVLYPSQVYGNNFTNISGVHNFASIEDPPYFHQQESSTNSFYQNMVLVPKTTKPAVEAKPMEKSAADLIVKIDNQNFDNGIVFTNTTPSISTFSNGGNLEELLNDIESISQRGTNVDPARQRDPQEQRREESEKDKPYKSELNVVLLPKPMPLIGFDKYEEIKRSFESIKQVDQLEATSSSQQNLFVPPPPPLPSQGHDTGETEFNPFVFNFKDNYVNFKGNRDSSEYFNMRYNPDNFAVQTDREEEQRKEAGTSCPRSSSKTNLLELTSSEHVSSENEENLRFKQCPPGMSVDREHQKTDDAKQGKSPRLTLRKKVSIHFKGKKDKTKSLPTTVPIAVAESSDTSTPKTEKKPLFDVKFSDKPSHQKTPSIESKKSETTTGNNQEPKTPTSSDSKTSTEKKDKGTGGSGGKSSSVSPERGKHVHMKDEGGGSKRHKKHKKASDRPRLRRGSGALAVDPSGRSFSICTDRSNVLENRLAGIGFGAGLYYDDGSEKDSNSSCDTPEHARKMSTMSSVPLNGKVPWCGCWGNGCL